MGIRPGNNIIVFLAPTPGGVGRVRPDDTIVVQNFSGQRAGPPTQCFTGMPKIFNGNLLRPGRRQPIGIEFIPVTRRSVVKEGLTIKNIQFIGNCLFGEDFEPRYRGQIVTTVAKR